jgi:hypothetical protein
MCLFRIEARRFLGGGSHVQGEGGRHQRGVEEAEGRGEYSELEHWELKEPDWHIGEGEDQARDRAWEIH